MLDRLIPKQHAFFDEFDRMAETIVRGAVSLREMLDDMSGLPEKVEKIRAIEHDGDLITHKTIALLHTTFITPVDRDQIFTLVSRLDDILDAIESAGNEFLQYDIHQPSPEARSLAGLLEQAARSLHESIQALRNLRQGDRILQGCVAVKSCETQGDVVLRGAIRRLFREEKDAIVVVKWKEIYENLEAALDRCEDVANVIEGIVLENA